MSRIRRWAFKNCYCLNCVAERDVANAKRPNHDLKAFTKFYIKRMYGETVSDKILDNAIKDWRRDA